MHNAHPVITDRQDIDPASHRATGRPETPRQGGGVDPDVPGSILLEYEACRDVIKKLLSLVAQRSSPYEFSFWIDERHVFRICSLDGRPSAFRVPLGKHRVQVAVKQLLASGMLILSRRDLAVGG